jgi:PPOX class probable F420-dependent enzyme
VAQLTDAQTKLFTDRNFASLATIRKDGTAHVSPVWVDWDGTHAVFNTAKGRAKHRHIERDARVTLTVWSADDPYRYVEVTGTARLVDEGADEHINKMAKKYIDQDVYPWKGPDEVRVIVEVTPERVTGMGWD